MPQETHVPLGTADPGRWAAAIGKALKATNEPADASASARSGTRVAQVLAVIAVRASSSDEAQLASPTARAHPRPRPA